MLFYLWLDQDAPGGSYHMTCLPLARSTDTSAHSRLRAFGRSSTITCGRTFGGRVAESQLPARPLLTANRLRLPKWAGYVDTMPARR